MVRIGSDSLGLGRMAAEAAREPEIANSQSPIAELENEEDNEEAFVIGNL